jgi:hypothetical protein
MWLLWALKHGSPQLKKRLEGTPAQSPLQVLLGGLHSKMHNTSCQLSHAGFYAKEGTRCNGEGCETGICVWWMFMLRRRLVPHFE